MVAVRQWWSVKELAEHYGLSSRMIYDAISAGDLVAHRFGRRQGGMRIAEEDRRSWEQQCKDTERVPVSLPSNLQDRLVMSELVQKHFGR
ncbi:MAG: helix-turn-helix domain-containing protein [Planctomycetales bacterium]|nr:helix-turn-helix domain-containing protein [Planctomycetales bacterium]